MNFFLKKNVQLTFIKIYKIILIHRHYYTKFTEKKTLNDINHIKLFLLNIDSVLLLLLLL